MLPSMSVRRHDVTLMVTPGPGSGQVLCCSPGEDRDPIYDGNTNLGPACPSSFTYFMVLKALGQLIINLKA